MPQEERDLDEVGAYRPCEPSWYQTVRLDMAFEGRAPEMLPEFFRAWHDQSTPGPLAEMPEVVRHAYAIFTDFYTPKDLTRFGRAQSEIDYTEAQYFILQDELRVVVTADVLDRWWSFFARNNKEGQVLKIEQFRPVTAFPDRVLHIDDRYRELLSRFIRGRGYFVYDSLGFDWETQARRASFLSPYVVVSPGDVNNWWETNPLVDEIRMDTDYRHAALQFWFPPYVGSALYRRGDDGVRRMIDFGWTGVM